MKIEINLKGNKAVARENDNLVDALEEFDTSVGIREHTGINLSEVYEDIDSEYFSK